MDQGHYNCRDYYVTPHFSPTTVVSESPRPPVERHESWDELEQRSRSPASKTPKFPLLDLPLELRQQILRYLLPHTREFTDTGLLGRHARNFRAARGMIMPTASASASGVGGLVWQKGNIHLLSVCQQLHDECAELVYGSNTFLLFVTYAGISFRLRWLQPSGAAPCRSYNFLNLLPEHYMHLIKRVFVHVDHVDSYTGMLKFNVDGNGLTHGLRKRVRSLVEALQATNESNAAMKDRRLSKVHIRVSNGNAVLDALKSNIVRQREGKVKVSEDIEEMLEPFGQLRGIQQVSVVGAVTESYARSLEARMTSERSAEEQHAMTAPSCHSQGKDVISVPFAGGDDSKLETNLANLIRGF